MEDYSVAIVVDRMFGDRVLDLAERIYVWICDTPANKPSVEKIWADTKNEKLERGVAIFSIDNRKAPEDTLIGELSTIDLHHGSYSHDPPWSRYEVYGARLSDQVKLALAEYGVDVFTETEYGFECARRVSEV